MISNFVRLLLSVCALLLVVLLLEIILSEAMDSSEQNYTATTPDDSKQINLPDLQLSGKALDFYADMVERPLFIEGRRPVSDTDEPSVSLEESKIDDLLLMGIYSLEDQLVALFRVKEQSDDTYLKKKAGDEVSGWQIMEVQSDQVLLARDGKKENLKLRAQLQQKSALKRATQRKVAQPVPPITPEAPDEKKKIPNRKVNNREPNDEQ